ncbi:hypothetical protein HK104_004329, partial [Borealophlyctis nickersoniae]
MPQVSQNVRALLQSRGGAIPSRGVGMDILSPIDRTTRPGTATVRFKDDGENGEGEGEGGVATIDGEEKEEKMEKVKQ